MKKTAKRIGLKAETLRHLAQHEIRNLADHELKIVAGGSLINCTNSHGCM